MTSVALLVKVGSNLSEPLGVDCAHLAHVLFASLHKFVVHNPLRTFVEETAARMDEDLLVVRQCLESLGRVLLCSVMEKSCANRLANFVVLFHIVGTAGDNRQFEAVQYHEQLIAHVLRTLQSTRLNEIVVTPLYVAAVLHPSLVDGQHCEVVAVFVVETGALLVSQLLFLSRTVKHILN